MQDSLSTIVDGASKGLDLVCRVLAAAFLVTIAVAASSQVVGRYMLGQSPIWLEELTRYSFVWMTMLGAGVLVRANGHAVIDVFVVRFHGVSRTAHTIMVYLFILFAAVILITQGVKIIGIVHKQLSPAMRVSMAYVYAAVPVGGVVIVVHCINELVSTLLGRTTRNGIREV